MKLPNVRINRAANNLGRVRPTIDNVFGLVLSGTAVVDKIGLGDPKALFDVTGLVELGITAANNPLAYQEVNAFYSLAAAGTKLWIVLYSDATLLADVCDKNTGVVKSLLQHADGEIRGVFINKKLPSGYSMTKLEGLDQDVWNAAAKLQLLCMEMVDENMPCFAVLPGQGFTISAAGTVRDMKTMSANQVSICIAADDVSGKCASGLLAGWLSRLQVHQNIGWPALDSVTQQAWFVDGINAGDKSVKVVADTLHDKRYLFFRKIFQKSGFFWTDDPTATDVADDYSSISWNRVINKAHILCYNSLINHLLEDVEADPLTGGINPTVACDWEGDVEREIDVNMKQTGEITSARCRIDTTESNLLSDSISASLEIVRKGQAKNINVTIGYTTSINPSES